jgi:hypothetical protein
MENRATALASWAGWIAGIALLWTTSGVVAAGAWWLLYWPSLLGIAVACSRLEEHRQAEVAADSKKPVVRLTFEHVFDTMSVPPPP